MKNWTTSLRQTFRMKLIRPALVAVAGIVLGVFAPLSSGAATSIPNLNLSYVEFKELAEELSPKVNLFREVWAQDSSAEFFGGTSRDYLYWLRRQFRDCKTNEESRAVINRLRGLPVIDVREFIVGDSDVDVASMLSTVDIDARRFSVKKLDLISKDRFVLTSEMGQNEVKQGFAPVEKIRLGMRHLIMTTQFGDGIREIYEGKPTVVFASDEDFKSTFYAKQNLNHPILLALRYLRLLAANYYNIYGKNYPNDKLLTTIDPKSALATQKVINSVLEGSLAPRYMSQPQFYKWMDGTIQKSFRSYTNPTAAKLLYQKFGADRLTLLYNLSPVAHTLFAKFYDQKAVEENLRAANLKPESLYTKASEVFGKDLMGYHGTKQIDHLRSILFEGFLQSTSGLLGRGLYLAPFDNFELAKTFAGGKEELVVKIKIAAEARIIDLTKHPELRRFEFDQIADKFGADIILDWNDDFRRFAVIKNGGVVTKITGYKVTLTTITQLLQEVDHLRTVEDMRTLILTTDYNSFSDFELKILAKKIIKDSRTLDLLLKLSQEKEIKKVVYDLIFSAADDHPELCEQILKEFLPTPVENKFSHLLEWSTSQNLDLIDNESRNIYKFFIRHYVIPDLKRIPFSDAARMIMGFEHLTNLNGYDPNYIAELKHFAIADRFPNGYGYNKAKGLKSLMPIIFSEIIEPKLKSTGPDRAVALGLLKSIFNHETANNELFESIGNYLKDHKDSELTRQFNIEAAKSYSSAMPSTWFLSFSQLTPERRIESFADFFEATTLYKKNRSDLVDFLSTHVVHYEYDRKNLPLSEIQDMTQLMITKYQKLKTSKPPSDAIRLANLENAIQLALSLPANKNHPELVSRAKTAFATPVSILPLPVNAHLLGHGRRCESLYH